MLVSAANKQKNPKRYSTVLTSKKLKNKNKQETKKKKKKPPSNKKPRTGNLPFMQQHGTMSTSEQDETVQRNLNQKNYNCTLTFKNFCQNIKTLSVICTVK